MCECVCVRVCVCVCVCDTNDVQTQARTRSKRSSTQHMKCKRFTRSGSLIIIDQLFLRLLKHEMIAHTKGVIMVLTLGGGLKWPRVMLPLSA